MNNKGLSYIDWSISIGIFVIFVLALFILVVPSLDRRLDENYLISIAETGFKENTYYTIYKLPLFIDSSSSYSSVKINIDLPMYPANYNSLGIVDESFNEIDKNVTTHKFGPVDISNGVNTFNFLYLFNEFHTYPFLPGGTNLNCGSDISCTFGIEEKLRGFSRDKLDNLFVCGEYSTYTSFKGDVSYPEQRELSVLLYEGTGFEGNVLYNCTFKEPENLDQVYALNWKDNILNFNGSLEEVTVLIRTW